MTYSVFTDRPKNEEPIRKLKKYSNTQLIEDLLSFLSRSDDLREDTKRVKQIIERLQELQTHRKMYKVEFEELKCLEMEILESSRYNKMVNNEYTTRETATKCFAVTNWMTALAAFVFYKVCCADDNKPIDSRIFMYPIWSMTTFVWGPLLMTSSTLFRYNLVHDGTRLSGSKLDLEKMFEEMTDVEISEEMMKEQIRIINVYTTSCFRVRSECNRCYWKLFSVIPFYYYIWTCFWMFVERYQETGDYKEHEYAFDTSILTFVTTFFIMFIFSHI